MKKKKQLKRIIILILVMLAVIVLTNVSYGSVSGYLEYMWSGEGFEDLLQGVAGVVALGYQQFAALIFSALELLTKAVTGVTGDGNADSMYSVIFNEVELTSANFFPSILNGVAAQGEISTKIGQYYNLMRALAIALSLFVLVYVGIRMLISTVADEQAKYKKMMVDWGIGLATLFVLHYIIIIVFVVNDKLVEMLKNANPAPDASVWHDLFGLALIPGAGLDELVVYGAFVVANLAFVLTYVKRAIVLAFLIVIAPLITVTYAIDRIGDGKSQALNAWLREFMSTVLIQPFHCIIYITFYGTIMSTVGSIGSIGDVGLVEWASGSYGNIGQMFVAAASAFFMLKAENIVKKIFGIQPNSMGDTLGTGAMAITAATSMFKKGGSSGKSSSGSSSSGGKMPTMKNNESNTSGLNGVATHISNAVGDENSLKTSKSPFVRSFSRHASDWVGRKATGAATLAGAIAGGTVGDFKTAASTATAVGGVAKGIQEDLEVKRNERRLEKNQKVFAGAYNDFAEAYKRDYGASHGGAVPTDKQIRQAAQKVFDSKGKHLNAYQQDLYDQMKQLSKSAKIGGEDDGFDFIENTIKMAQAGAIEPPRNYRQKMYP